MSDVQITIGGQNDAQVISASLQETQIVSSTPGIQGPVGLGFPSGGTANQVLFKQSDTSYDATWSYVTSAMIGDLEITNSDVAANAAIAHSKLANITAGQILLGNASNVPTATAVSGDVVINSSGVTAISSGVIVDSDINASAAIVDTKLATISTAGKVSNSATTATSANTANAIVARDASGNFSAGTITADLAGNASTVTTNANLTGDITSVGNATSIASGVIVNADVNASAAIAGTKISPNFGSQNVTTTGTSTAASFIPTNSTVPTNGLYLPAANSVALSTGGTGRLFISSTGQIGIGGTPSGSNLNIIDPVPIIRLTDSDTNGYSQILGSDTSLYIDADRGAAGTGALIFRTSGTNERLRITSAGLVGIGTASPITALHVYGASSQIRVESSTGTDGNVRFINTSGSMQIGLTGAGGNTFLIYDNINAALAYQYAGAASAGTHTWYTNNTERLRITSTGQLSHIGAGSSGSPAVAFNGSAPSNSLVVDSNGLIGAGTSSPAAEIHINSSSLSRLRFTGGAANATNFDLRQGVVGVSNSGVSLYDVSAAATRVVVDNQGRVGIGTSTPTGGGLNVSSDTANAIVLQRTNITTGIDQTVQTLRFLNGLAVNNYSADISCYQTTAFPDSVGLQFKTKSGGTADPVTRMTINGLGSVGIGTSGPATILDINDPGTGLRLSNAASGNFNIGLLAGTGNANAFIYQRANASLIFGTNNAEVGRWDNSGRLLVGTATSTGQGVRLQVEGTDFGGSGAQIRRNSADGSAPSLAFQKSRGTTNASVTSVQDADRLMQILAFGADGTTNLQAAEIAAFVDGTPGANDMPGRLVFSTTADGAASPTERLRITSTGQLSHIGAGSSGSPAASFSGSAASNSLVVDSSSRVGIGTSAPTGAVDVASGGLSLILGADASASTRTNTTNKQSRIGGFHYTNAEEPVAIATTISTATGGSLYFGGGTSSMNAATEIQFYTAANNTTTTGTARMTIDSTGRVGIGTASPAAAFHVLNSSTTPAQIESSGVRSILLFRDSGTGANYPFVGSDNSALILRGGNAGAENVRIDSSARLLVGTASAPTGTNSQYSKFVVAGNSANSISGYISIGTASSSASYATGTEIGLINFTDNGAGEFASIRCATDAACGAGDFPGRLVFSTTSDGAASPTERLRIDSSGRVGIGTASPGSFDPNGNQLVVGNGLQNQGITIYGSPTTQSILYFADGTSGTQSYTGYVAYDHSADALRFGINGGTERFRCDSSGRLLVGTASSAGYNAKQQVVDTSGLNLELFTNIANADGAGLFLTKSRGTFASPAEVADGDTLGIIGFRGYDGAAYRDGAYISAQADGTWTDGGDTTDNPSRLVFSTTSDASASPTERLRITSTGQVRLAGAGITFNGDTAAANELDDYEEGTFTPTVVGTTTAGTATYAAQIGRYTKIGNLVNFTVYLSWSGGTGSGDLKVNGLPFTINSEANRLFACSVAWVEGLSLTAGHVPQAALYNNETRINIQGYPTGGTSFANVAYDAGAAIAITGSYTV